MGSETSFMALTKSEVERISKCIRDAQEHIYGAQGQIHRAQGLLNEANNLLSARTCGDAATTPTPVDNAAKVAEREDGNAAITSVAQEATIGEVGQMIPGIMSRTESAEAELKSIGNKINTDDTKSIDARKPTRPPRFTTTAMTDEQQAFLRSQLSYTRKTRNAIYFLKPVDHIALELPTYPSVITQPMDLGTIDTKLRSNEYASVQAFFDDIQLIVDNSLKFNGASHAITHAAYSMMAYVQERLKKYATTRKSSNASAEQQPERNL